MKDKIKRRKILLIVVHVFLILTLVGAASYVIYYLTLNTSQFSRISSKFSNSLKDDKYQSLLSKPIDPSYKQKLHDENPSKALEIDCQWIEDSGNKNVTFNKWSWTETGVSHKEGTVIGEDILCELKTPKKNLIKGQFPQFFFDDFAQNFFSNDYLRAQGVEIESTVTGWFGKEHTTDYKKIVTYINEHKKKVIDTAKRIIRIILSKISYLSELSLVNRITFQNKDSSNRADQDTHGSYWHFNYPNDKNNNRVIKIVVDTYTDKTKPLKGDINAEPNLRFDLENAIATIVHEYGHHLTLYAAHLNSKSFLAILKIFFHNAEFGLNKDKKKIFGSWKEFEKLYRFANDLNSTTNNSEIIDIFRRLYGMHKVKVENDFFFKRSVVTYPDNYKHKLKYWKSSEPEKVNSAEVAATATHVVKTEYSRRNLDAKIEGAQKIGSMLPNTNLNYKIIDHMYNGKAYDFELNCSNEYFYFTGSSYDFEAIIAKNANNYTDKTLLATIKYYFSYEELATRILTILTFQYEKLQDESNIRPPRGCGFNIHNQLTRISIDFDDNVRLENRVISDYLTLKRMGIDVFKESKNLMESLVPVNLQKINSKNEIKILNYKTSFSNQCNDFSAFPFNTDKDMKQSTNNEVVYNKRYKILAMINLDESETGFIPNIKISNFINSSITINVVPFNYVHIYYYSYLKGREGEYNNDAFKKNNLLHNQYGIVFDVGGENLIINEACQLFKPSTFTNATFYIDKNENNQFDVEDVKLKVVL